MGSLAIRSFETIRLTMGSDQLCAESMTPDVFRQEEAASYLGRIYDHWLATGESTECSFLLPSAASFRPRRVMSRTEGRMIFAIALDEDGIPANDIGIEEAVIGRRHPFASFTLSSINDCRQRRMPLYFHMSLQLDEVELDFTRLLLPSVDDRDRIARIDVAHRFIGERCDAGKGSVNG